MKRNAVIILTFHLQNSFNWIKILDILKFHLILFSRRGARNVDPKLISTQQNCPYKSMVRQARLNTFTSHGNFCNLSWTNLEIRGIKTGHIIYWTFHVAWRWRNETNFLGLSRWKINTKTVSMTCYLMLQSKNFKSECMWAEWKSEDCQFARIDCCTVDTFVYFPYTRHWKIMI